jgi:2-dehydro-3-deoxy-D-arabinonate dehydratase
MDAPDATLWGLAGRDGLTPLNASAVQRALLGQDPAGLENLNRLATGGAAVPLAGVRLLPPLLPGAEVWAAGVTYESSKYARMSESEGGGDFYARVYVADRPELFFKATPHRTVGHGVPVRLRGDSKWNVPEPELAVVASPSGAILGYTIGNDMSSRDIEGANPLYLPQAKVYLGSCALGPWIVPAGAVDPSNLAIRLSIERDGRSAYQGETSTARMRRSPEELVGWAMRENEFPGGLALLTGTGVIPPDDFTLMSGDAVSIEIEGIGELRNPVE